MLFCVVPPPPPPFWGTVAEDNVLAASCVSSQDNPAHHQGCSGATLVRAENLRRSRPGRLWQPGVSRARSHINTHTCNIHKHGNQMRPGRASEGARPKANSCASLVFLRARPVRARLYMHSRGVKCGIGWPERNIFVIVNIVSKVGPDGSVYE